MTPETTTRRGFLDYLLSLSFAGSLAAIAFPVWSFLFPPLELRRRSFKWVAVCSVSDLPAFAGKLVPYRDSSALVINTGDGIAAFKAICTHQYCLVKWDQTRKIVVCPCHLATFDMKGNVLGGPAPMPLIRLIVQVKGDKIYVI